MKTAVAFIVFRRPDTTRMVFEQIKKARPPILFVIADAPKAGRTGEAERCAEVRAFIEAGVDWPCELRRIYAKENLGCAKRVSSGLDEVFRQVEEAIILEDDCLPALGFFAFCEEMLERYRRDERIAQIAGCSFQSLGGRRGRTGHYLSIYPHCWGWATWRRSWQHYRHDISVEVRAGFPWLSNLVQHPDERRYWRHNFTQAQRGRIDSWANRWTCSVWARGCLSVLSYPNLVSNIGFGDNATHTGTRNHPVAGLPLEAQGLRSDESFSPERDAEADELTSRLLHRRQIWILRLATRLFRGVRKVVRFFAGRKWDHGKTA